jgi:methionine sulfoxide reductase heme-binding subunit
VTAQQALRFILKPVVFVAALGPVAWLAWAGLTGHLSVNPLSDLTNETGLWALRFLCVSLAITPLRRLTHWNAVIRFRRMMGLYAFFYGVLHFLVYTIADRFAGLDFPDGIASWTTVRSLAASVGADIYKRPFITIGFTTLMLMLPLAITSTAGWIRRLGGKRWNRLHMLAYAAGVAAVVHYYWLVKADVRSPLLYVAIVALLLGLRVYWARMKAMTAVRPARPALTAR